MSTRPEASERATMDVIQPFHLAKSRINGRILRLGPALDQILQGHGYPEAVGRTLAEALALTALFGTGLKFDSRFSNGRFTLQTRTDGPLGFVVVHFDPPGYLRGYASVTAGRAGEAPAAGPGDQVALLGNGHLAMTIDPGGTLDSYQGIVPLQGETLVEAAHTYFRQSEQLPTFIRLAIGRVFADKRWTWTAGALIVQHIPGTGRAEGPLTEAEAAARDAALDGDDSDGWRRAQILAGTVEDHELLDPEISPERLIGLLFREEEPRVYQPVPLSAACRCSRDRLKIFLTRFGRDELSDMREADGDIRVTCEFCKTDYRFKPDELG